MMNMEKKKLTSWNASAKRAAEKRRAIVRALRAKRWTWTAIGRKFGVTRQRAQQLAVSEERGRRDD